MRYRRECFSPFGAERKPDCGAHAGVIDIKDNKR
jgi:hypothetical protein